LLKEFHQIVFNGLVDSESSYRSGTNQIAFSGWLTDYCQKWSTGKRLLFCWAGFGHKNVYNWFLWL